MEELRRLLLDNGASLAGFADLSRVPEAARGGMGFGISIAVALGPEIVAGVAEGPTVEYRAEYKGASAKADSLATLAARRLEEMGYRATAQTVAAVKVDPPTMTSVLPHKTVATRAGLGWIGKCALLVTTQFGSAIRLSSVVTDAPLPAGEPVEEARCGDCTACAEACPGRAPSGLSWKAGLHRDEFLDMAACRKTAREISARRTGAENSGCGICIAACPWTKRYLKRGGHPRA